MHSDAFLPEPSMAPSLSGEIEQEMGRKTATVPEPEDDDDYSQGSLLFPAVPSPNPTLLLLHSASSDPERRRTLSASSAPANNRYSTTSTTYGGDSEAAQYGADLAAETRSLFMGGSRPPSTLRQTHRRNQHASLAFSVTSEADTVASASALGYLFLEDAGDESATSQADMMSPSPERESTVRTVPERRPGGHSSRPIRSMYGVVQTDEPPVPTIPVSFGDTDVHYRGHSQHLNSEEAWYFLRQLVGEELRLEEGMLWKLSSLLVEEEEEDLFAGAA